LKPARASEPASASKQLVQKPVLFLVFNRPDHTARAFEAIRAARPPRLYVAADGARGDRPEEAEACAEVRRIATAVDWDCEVRTLFRTANLGCGRAVSEAIDWFFGMEEEGIVLEDDCIAGPDFFPFCDALLERFRDDTRVWAITGNNFQDGRQRGDGSYYFSKYVHVWGWASWRRAWDQFRLDIPFWPNWRRSAAFRAQAGCPAEQRYWTGQFDRVWDNQIDSWAYPWMATTWYHGGLTATPNANLVTNIGIGPLATHTVAPKDRDGLPVAPLGPLVHPSAVERDVVADEFVFDTIFGSHGPRGWGRIRSALIRRGKRMLAFAVGGRPRT
jgi:hypothetical protein